MFCELTPREAMEARLHRLASAALAATRAVDDRGSVLCTTEGMALVNAAYDVTRCDVLYDLAREIRLELSAPLYNVDYHHDSEREFHL